MKRVGYVRTLPIFRHLTASRVSRLARASSDEYYRKGAALFRQGAEANYIWIVVKGWVHLVRMPSEDDHSHAVVLFTVTPSEALCGISALDADAYSMSGVAATDCRALRIPAKTFNEAVTHEALFAYDVLRLYTRRMRQIAEQYGAMAEPVSQRIIRAILRLREQFGDTIPMTHRELAQMSWTTTESAIRAIRQLKHRGLLAGARGQLTIKQAENLERLLKVQG